MSNRRVLNAVNGGGEEVKGPVERELTVEQLGLDLQRSMLSLKGQFLADDGSGVNYHSLRTSAEFKDYCAIAEKLNYVQLKPSGESTLTEDEIKSFFINVYNALTIHGLSCADPLPSSVLEVEGFWRITCYNIGGLVYSLDDIEHGILRCNRPHPGGDVMFEKADPRLQFSVKSLDPRIHFALVCGAKSCPAIQVYSSAKLDRNLTVAAKSFCGQEVSIDQSQKKVILSKIFLWYSKDFGDTNSQLLTWVSDYLPDEDRSLLQRMMVSSESSISLSYKEYNWLLNKL